MRRPETARSGAFLPQIQALRAGAVLMVVAYHIGPTRVTGGYVGVDVFFVISGYLMTAHILRSSDAGSGVRRGLADFYIRRLRRILPASLFLLAVVSLLTLAVVPRTSWLGFFRELRASALFYENWSLASSSTDYLAAGNGNPVQHFWSLSVEEQFYVVWPLALLTLGVVFAARRRSVQTAFIIVVLVASLGFSVAYTQSDPTKAYFNTGTRLWEFAVGGLLASLGLVGRLGAMLSALSGWLGLVVLAVCIRLFTADTRFPSYTALVPVVATAAVMLSADATTTWWSPSWLFGLRPVQYVGNISYSVYLWHFPLVVLIPLLRDEPLKPKVGLLIFFLSLVLGDLSQRFVEAPFRGHRPPGVAEGVRRWKPSLNQTVPILGGLLLITVVVATVQIHRIGHLQDRARSIYQAVDRTPPSCYGGEVLGGEGGCSPTSATLHGVVPDPLIASTGFDHQCLQGETRTSILTCHFGSRTSLQIALVGDSHATAYLPAVEDFVERQGWGLTTYLKAGCMLTSDGPDQPCKGWNAKVLTALHAKRYPVVVVSGRSQYLPGTTTRSVVVAARAVARSWRSLESAGSVIVALRDSPQPVNAGRTSIPDCVDRDPDPGACDFPRAPALRFEVMSAAAAIDSKAHLVDLDGYFCSVTTCAAVLGGVLVYVDDNHITRTFARSLDEPIAQGIASALG